MENISLPQTLAVMAWVPIDAFLALQPLPIMACELLCLSRFFTSIFIVIKKGVDLSLNSTVWGVWIDFGSWIYSLLRVPSAKGLSSICCENWFKFVWDPGGKYENLGFFIF